MPEHDPFDPIARYYDPIMEHVDYDRWQVQVESLAAMLPGKPRHLDAACGTANLIHRLRAKGWQSCGIDLSPAMIQAARKRDKALPLAVADLRALPFGPSFQLVTCLFDSINFILDEDDLRLAIKNLGQCLALGGILYFDAVTERMVRTFFEGPGWVEDNGRFSTRWQTAYDRKTAIADTSVSINKQKQTIIRERIYPQATFENAIEGAGLTLLDVFDTETLKSPNSRTTRIDFIAALKPTPALRREYATFRHCLALLQGKD